MNRNYFIIFHRTRQRTLKFGYYKFSIPQNSKNATGTRGRFSRGHGDVSPVPLSVGHAKRPRVPASPCPRRIILLI